MYNTTYTCASRVLQDDWGDMLGEGNGQQKTAAADEHKTAATANQQEGADLASGVAAPDGMQDDDFGFGES